MSQPSHNWQSLFETAQTALATTGSRSQTIPPPPSLSSVQIAAYIDHTLLKLDATESQIDTLCAEADRYHFGAVCVRLPFVARVVRNVHLHTPEIKVACVIGFHEGTQSKLSKVTEAKEAVAAGASELDVVLNRTLLQTEQYQAIYEELKELRDLAPEERVLLKLIFETSQLSREQIINASVLAHHAGFDFIKTSTGFCGRGASKEDVILMKSCAVFLASQSGRLMKVKASGGVRGYEDAKAMIELGAERIGTSSGVQIVEEARTHESGTGGEGAKGASSHGVCDGY